MMKITYYAKEIVRKDETMPDHLARQFAGHTTCPNCGSDHALVLNDCPNDDPKMWSIECGSCDFQVYGVHVIDCEADKYKTNRTEPLNPDMQLPFDTDEYHCLDDELNMRTGTPHWSCILDELDAHLDESVDECNIPLSLIMSALRFNLCALEDAILEIYSLQHHIDVLKLSHSDLNEEE